MSDLSLPLSAIPAALPVTAAPASAPARAACASCGRALLGEFCHGCGQRVQAGRITVRGIAAHLVTDAFDLDTGFLHTADALFRRPGEAVREYLGGATVRYANPVKYLLIMVALTVLLYMRLHVFEMQMGAFPDAAQGSARMQEMQAQVNAWMSRHMNLLMVGGVPVTAWLSGRFFRSAGFNYAEHLVFNVFAYAQMCLLTLIVLPLTQAAGLGTRGLAAASLLNVAYYVWALTSFTRSRPLSGLIRGAAVQLLALLAMSVVGGVVGAAIAMNALAR